MFKLNRVKQFKSQSTKSLNIFNKTIADLIKVNKEISKRIKVNRDKVNALTLKNNDLDKVKFENEQVITKIKNITL